MAPGIQSRCKILLTLECTVSAGYCARDTSQKEMTQRLLQTWLCLVLASSIIADFGEMPPLAVLFDFSYAHLLSVSQLLPWFYLFSLNIICLTLSSPNLRLPIVLYTPPVRTWLDNNPLYLTRHHVVLNTMGGH